MPELIAELALVVLYVKDIETSKQFYETVGITFTKEKHGTGPEHFACQLGAIVLEIYPRDECKSEAPAVRIGFSVPSVDSAFERLENLGAQSVTSPQDSPWGRRAVVRDPDGYTVELNSRPA